MTRFGGLGIVVLSGLLIGCQPKPPEPPPQPPALGYDEIRTELTSSNPGAVVGEVGGTQLDAHLVLIKDVDPGKLQLGDAVSFLDDRMNILTIGSVTEINPDGNIIVRIEPPAEGMRDPEIDDVAVHIPPGSTLNTTLPPAPATNPEPTTMPAPAAPPDVTTPTPPAAPATEPSAAPAPAIATQPGADMSPATPPAPATPAAPPTPAVTPAPATEPAPAPQPPPAPPMTQPEMNK